MGIDTLIEDWLEDVKTMSDLTVSEKEEVTRAGAEAFAKELTEVTRRDHTSKRKYKLKKHLYETVGISKAKQKDGTHIVGFGDDRSAVVARFVNDGTKKMKASHFVTNLQNSNEVNAKVFNAERKAYEEILERRGHGING
ncbi:HK97-gp10 family putative phage morphogenesis protein [Streptococcus ferus]|uniref:HK97-gp10 family putative phage morphogenesis protein n=1 Tax=Streptococcus ferus TaxID=1345 RepID=UPI0035197AAD